MENQEEINNAISAPALSDLDTDLEQELEDLLMADLTSTSTHDRISTNDGDMVSTNDDDSLDLKFSSLVVDDIGGYNSQMKVYEVFFVTMEIKMCSAVPIG